MDWLALAAGAGVAMALLAWLPLRVEVLYRHRQGLDHLEVDLRWAGGLLRMQLRVPLLDWWMEGLRPRLRVQAELRGPTGRLLHRRAGLVRRWRLPMVPLDARLWRSARMALRVNRRFFRRVRLQEFRWQTALGFADPALTGIAMGLGWIWLARVRRVLVENVRLSNTTPVLNLVPRFSSPGFETNLNCIFVLRGGDIMLSLLGFARAAGLYFLTGQRRGSGERASHRGTDEDGHGKHQGNG